MAGLPPPVRTALRQLPLGLVWLAAAWPVGLWLLHLRDPELAVVVARGTARGLWAAAAWGLGAALLLCLVFPPAPAWLRRAWHRTWQELALDRAPLQRALTELKHFATAARHAEVGRLARLRRQHELAATHFAAAVALDDGMASAWHQLGLAHFAMHRWQPAAAAFAKAEALDPGHAFGDALLHLGRARHELGDPDALAILQQHARQHGGGARSQLWLADALRAAGEPAAAREALRQAAAPPRHRLSAEDNWFRALARVRLWGKGGRP